MDHTHSQKEKTKARKSGPSLERKTRQLGETANVFALLCYFDPTHGIFHTTVNKPCGEDTPDVNQLMAEALSRPKAAASPRHRRNAAKENRRRDRKSLRRSARQTKKPAYVAREETPCSSRTISPYDFDEAEDARCSPVPGRPGSGSPEAAQQAVDGADAEGFLSATSPPVAENDNLGSDHPVETSQLAMHMDETWTELEASFLPSFEVDEPPSAAVLDAIFPSHVAAAKSEPPPVAKSPMKALDQAWLAQVREVLVRFDNYMKLLQYPAYKLNPAVVVAS